MKQNFKSVKALAFSFVCAAAFCVLFSPNSVFAQSSEEADLEKYIAMLQSVSKSIPKEELKNLQSRLPEIEKHLSQLKSHESELLAELPKNIRNQKFASSAERIEYYQNLSDEYLAKLGNEQQLGGDEVKMLDNIMILLNLYTTEESVKLLKDK